MNAPHPANALYHALNRITRKASPLEILETEARKIWPSGAERGSLYVLARQDGSFVYEWGNSEVSRREAALRAAEFEREQSKLFWEAAQ